MTRSSKLLIIILLLLVSGWGQELFTVQNQEQAAMARSGGRKGLFVRMCNGRARVWRRPESQAPDLSDRGRRAKPIALGYARFTSLMGSLPLCGSGCDVRVRRSDASG
jgi:hypothetical protein